MPLKTAAIIRHIHFEDLGSFAEPLTRAGYEFTYYDVGNALPPLDPMGRNMVSLADTARTYASADRVDLRRRHR